MGVDDLTLLFEFSDSNAASDHRERYAEVIAENRPFQLCCPGRSHVLGTLANRVGETVVSEDLERGVVGARPFTESTLDNTDVLVFMARLHDLLQFDISKWSEDLQSASPGTISRSKMNLIDAGCLETTMIPQAIGHPRKRLHLAGPLADISDISEVIETREGRRESGP